MKYTWLHIGDQERCLHQACFLGIYMLEIIENGWTRDDRLMLKCRAKIWCASEESYVNIKQPMPKVSPSKTGMKKGRRLMENWYAEYVILPTLVMGKDDTQTL